MDKRRFSTIDNQFNAMTSISGDGRLTGWDIELLTFPDIKVTKGSGFIDKFYVTTFDDQEFTLPPSSITYFYAQRRVGVSSVLGPLSDVASLTYSDTGAPNTPSGFTSNNPISANKFFNIELSWNTNSDIDLDHYEIERTSNYPPAAYVLIATVDKSLTTYIDSTDEDATYYYRLYAVDQSGFRSNPANTSHAVLLSPNLPPNPIEVQIRPSEGAINVLWKRPVSIDFSKIDHWEVIYTRLNSDSTEILSTQQNVDVNKNELFVRLDNLSNGELYNVTIQTVDNKNRNSDGITKTTSPTLLLAPKDPELITFIETELVTDRVAISLAWTDGADEYDPLTPYRYNVYVTLNGQQESNAINVPIGEADQQIELYTFDGINFLSIDQNALITLRITSISQNGQESKGNYLRFFTANFGQPLPVGNLQSTFNVDTGEITVIWDNKFDTSNIHINILDDDLNSDYAVTTIVNKNLGLVEFFIFSAELSHTYTITVTPINSNEVSGPSDTTIEITLISGGFPLPALPQNLSPQSGDRQISFTWIESPSISVISYKIYKKIGATTITATDWILLDTVPNTINSFEDFGLENNQIYSYYITSVDIYNQESLHLVDGAVNLNFIEITPKASGIIIEPNNVSLSLTGDDILITWSSLPEEFDSFEIKRSIGNLHLWKKIATVDRNTTSYLDETVPLVDGTIFYYAVGKTLNDTDIVIQASSVSPENSIPLGNLVLNATTFGSLDTTDIREILNLTDPIGEFTSSKILSHKHKGIDRFDPDRIDLRPELIVTNWETTDGRIFTTEELDITGTGYVVKINSRFPEFFFEVDSITRRLIFSEPIVDVDEAGNVTGTLPTIEVRVLGVEEVKSVLPVNRFNKIHARQVAFGRLNKEQLPSINHEGRIRETLFPKTFNLERFSNHTFIIPQGNADDTKNFGNGTTFFATIEGDGLIGEVVNFDQRDNGDLVAFRNPDFSLTTFKHLKTITTSVGVDLDINDATDVAVAGSPTWGNTTESSLFMGRSSLGPITADTYLRLKINIPKGSIIQASKISFTPFGTVPVDINLSISLLDPSGYTNSTEVSPSNAAALRLLGNINSLSVKPWIVSGWTNGTVDDGSTTPDLLTFIQAFIDRSAYSFGDNAIFSFKHDASGTQVINAIKAGTTSNSTNLTIESINYISEVTDKKAFQSKKSYHFQFSFTDTDSSRWVRISTEDTTNVPNPIIDLKKRLRFRILLESGSLYVALGIRETNSTGVSTGDNGGTLGAIEWVGTTKIITDDDGDSVPVGKLITGMVDTWQEVEFDLELDSIVSFENGNNLLDGDFGVLEHLAFTIVSEDVPSNNFYDVYIDKIEQVDDVLASGTSQGILLSRDFGSTWNTVRFVETPVHKFYKAINNPFIWAVGANTVLLATDLENWFETSGLTGSQYIRDITEDEFGNMYVSTDKGVYWFEIGLINNFSSWRQTQPVNAFTTDCYGLYHNVVSSGIDEIWVSTEIGIFKTSDQGQTWQDTNMSTQGLPTFQFINISTNSLLPNIISITRKHILRKLGSETDFSVLANLEVQHDIFDIWIFEYFAGKLYISTEKGVYTNTVDELFVPGITTVFDKIFPGLDINGQTGIAFGLDSIQTETNTNQLFIGQENKLSVSDESNVLSIKEQFPNKELPSFFQENTELSIGYIYNAFNSVLIFRSPQFVDKIYKSTHLPRKIFIPINDGWSHTNPEADVFIYVNGLPKWVDFKLDKTQILSDIQILQGKLDPIVGTLTDFNSLDPDASDKLNEVLIDITNMIEGGEKSSTLINNTTIIKFIEDYTKFLSLITNSVVLNNGLDVFPKINITGFVSSLREANSRAEILEIQENFIASDSTGININTVTGEVDFLTIFTATTDIDQKLEYVFNKNDKMLITIFNSNVANIGDFTHRQLENKMESVNTGLSSHLTRAHYANLIKAGIFMETNHNFLFDRFKVSNIQSKFNAAHTNDWYDIINSTIDYNSVVKVENKPESHFANTIHVFTENPYLLDKIWVGTNSDILQYNLDTTNGTVSLEKSIRPGNGINELFIWDIFVLNEDDIYVVAEEKNTKIGHIFRTTDSGATWIDLDTINLPQKIYRFSILNGNKVAGTENGIFFSDNNFGTWFPSNLILSDQLTNNSPSVSAFTQRIFNIEVTTFLIAESDKWFYTSGSGIEWFALGGQITINDISVVNKIVRFKSLTWVATDKGLYNDGNSILSNVVQFGLQTELESSVAESSKLNIADISVGVDSFYCSAGNKIYRFLNNEWLTHEVVDVFTIHKILLRETSLENWLIITSHNIIKVIDVTPTTGVFG